MIAAQLSSGISTTRAYEAERRRAEELAELDRAKTAFFTNISHELRTSLTLLLGPAEDALGDHQEALSEANRHRMEIIERNAERLLKLVNTLEVATYYQAGVEGTRVGGDWYDAIDLGAGRTALVVGDVAGRGIRAASLMGQLRAAVRAYTRLDLPPAEVLEQLDAIVYELSDNQLVTCIYGVHDPATGELRYANAGHLPPLIVTPGETACRLPEATGPPLGVGASQFGEHRVTLPTGAVLVMYTDGLVERRDRDLDAGIDALAAHVRAGSDPVHTLPGALVDALAPGGSEDDIAILVARTSDESVQRKAELDVPPVGSAVQDGRHFATATLTDWELPPEVVQDATLIVSELLTNAIVHGSPPIRLRLRKTPEELAIEVDDAASAMPRKLRATPTDLHGRGLAIVADIGSRWAARADGYGKTVWSTLAIPPTPSQR